MKKALKLICALLLVATLFGCSKKVDVSGEYYLLRIDAESDALSEESLQILRDYGIEFKLVLKNDGTGTFYAMGEEMKVEYDLEKKTATVGNNQESFRYENGQILMEDSGGTMVFEKVKQSHDHFEAN